MNNEAPKEEGYYWARIIDEWEVVGVKIWHGQPEVWMIGHELGELPSIVEEWGEKIERQVKTK